VNFGLGSSGWRQPLDFLRDKTIEHSSERITRGHSRAASFRAKRKLNGPIPLGQARFGLFGEPLKPTRVEAAGHSPPAGMSICSRSYARSNSWGCWVLRCLGRQDHDGPLLQKWHMINVSGACPQAVLWLCLSCASEQLRPACNQDQRRYPMST